MTFSEKLTGLRRKSGMSQEQLADRLGVTRQSVSKWEGGTAMPELVKLISLSELFGVSVDYLVKDWMEEPDNPCGGSGEISSKQADRLEKKVDELVAELYERLCEEPTLMPNFYLQIAYNEGVDRAVTDYISGMSDEFATRLFEELFIPQKWHVL